MALRILSLMHCKESHPMRISRTISAVQTPIIPVIGEWTRNPRFALPAEMTAYNTNAAQ
jgi:hypothetical protein